MMDIYYILGLFDHIPLWVRLWLGICVLPVLCLVLDDLIHRGHTGLTKLD